MSKQVFPMPAPPLVPGCRRGHAYLKQRKTTERLFFRETTRIRMAVSQPQRDYFLQDHLSRRRSP